MAEPQEDPRGPGRNTPPVRGSSDDETAAANSWPAGWPRLYPERSSDGADGSDGSDGHDGSHEPGGRGTGKASRRVSFVGGSADGLSDLVQEAAPGRLPTDLETMGSVYRLVETAGDDPRYHWHGFEDN